MNNEHKIDIMKKLKGVNAVQTLSRLNRICPPFEKKTFILDFVNSYEDIIGAFSSFYTTTLLSNSVTPNAIYDIEAQIDAYVIMDPYDIESVNEILYKEKAIPADKKKINFCLNKSQKLVEHYDLIKQHEIVMEMRHFVRFYEFMIQASCPEYSYPRRISTLSLSERAPVLYGALQTAPFTRFLRIRIYRVRIFGTRWIVTRFAVFRLLIEVIDSAAELSACITLLITLYVPTFFKLLYH